MNLSTWAFALRRLWCANRVLKAALCAAVLLPLLVNAQCADVPSLTYTKPFTSAADYRKADAAVAAAIDWSLGDLARECPEDLERINAYVLVWLSGHPDVVVKLEPSVFPFFKQHPDLLYTALFAMARYEMKTAASRRSAIDAHTAALEAIGDRVKATKALRKDPSLRDFRKAWRRNRLNEWYTLHLN